MHQGAFLQTKKKEDLLQYSTGFKARRAMTLELARCFYVFDGRLNEFDQRFKFQTCKVLARNRKRKIKEKSRIKFEFQCYRYFEDFEKKIPREEIAIIDHFIRDAMDDLDSKYIMTICGSYRRGKNESGDIDVLITHPSYTSKNKEAKKKTGFLKDVVKCLEKKGLITDTISQGETKFMVCLGRIQIQFHSKIHETRNKNVISEVFS